MKTTLIAVATLLTGLTSQASEYFGSVTFNDMTLDVTLNDITNKVTFGVTGLKTGWVSMGFGSQQMNGTYCIIANEGGTNNSQERILGFHSYGTKLATDLISVDSYTTTATSASYSITRDLTVSSTEAQAYDFVAQAGTVDLIMAYGNSTAQHHAARFFGTIDFVKITTTSTKETIIPQELKVFPNPATNQLNVQLDKASAATTVTISDLQGKLIKQTEFVNQKLLNVNVSDITAGSYMVKVNGSNFLSTSIFVKK